MRILTVVFSLLLAGVANAGFEFRVDLDTPFSAGLANTTVSRNVYLAEIAPLSTSFQGTNFVRFNLTGGAGGTTVTGFTANPSFAGSLFNANFVNPIGGGLQIGLFNNALIAPDLNRRVLLGQVSLALGPAPSATPLVFSATGLAGGGDVEVRLNGSIVATNVDNDVFVANAFSGSVSVVPEPSSTLVLMAVGACGVALRRRRAA